MKTVADIVSDYLFLPVLLSVCLSTQTLCFYLQMHQIEDGQRAIGSNVTVVSSIYDGWNDAYANMLVGNSVIDQTKVHSFYYPNWSDPSRDEDYRVENIRGLSFSKSSDANLTRMVTWSFTNLPEDYNELNLTTDVPNAHGSPASLILYISSCPSSITFNTSGQNSSFVITSQSPAQFNDKGNCSCLQYGQLLFYANGTECMGKATCGADTKWIGCEDVQCWSGPKNITAMQLNCTVGSRDPFNCSFDDGFPPYTGRQYQLNNETISEHYILNSRDNGKFLTCNVSSAFFEATMQEKESPPLQLIVYYAPENSTLSNASPVIQVNESAVLTFSFSANPDSETPKVNIPYQGSSGLFTVSMSSSEGTFYTYNLSISVGSDQDYGSYRICASTVSPKGEDCVPFDISNVTVTVTHHETTFSITTDSEELGGLTAAIISVIVVVIVALIVLVAGIVVYRLRRTKQNNKENVKEERVNELYGSATNQENIDVPVFYDATNAGSGKEEKLNVLYGSTPEPSSADAALPTYAQVDLKQKRKGNNNEGFHIDTRVQNSKNTDALPEQNPTGLEVAYAAIDKSKKRNVKEAAGDVYSVVNKPRKKG